MRKTVILILLLLTAGRLMAYDIPIMKNAPLVDGEVGTEEWSESLKMENYYQTSPGDNTEPSENTLIMIGHDTENLYIAAVCDYESVEDMRLHHCSRDSIETDRVMIYLDTFNTKDKAYFFAANGYGEQADGIVTGYHRHDSSSDIYFLSEGSVTENGYTIEFAIPLRSIKYASGPGSRWSILIRRYLVEKDEEISTGKLDRGDSNYFNNYSEIVFGELSSATNLKIVPSVIASSEVHEDGSGTERDKNFNGELNLFYEPGTSITFTGTLNPDYSTIEADGYQIDVNNRYPLYFEEKRPFFIEETNPFNANINIYHTRNIVNPIWGCKVSYNKGKTGFFALASRDEEIPGTRFGYDGTDDVLWGFFSYKYRIDGNSDLRLAAASREYGGLWNNVLSMDSNLYFENGLHLHNQVAWSKTGLDNTEESGTAYYSVSAYDDARWHFEITAEGVADDFRADMGFINEKGIRRYASINRMLIMSYSDTMFFRFADFSMSGHVKYDWEHKNRLEAGINPYISMGFKYNLGLWIGMERGKESFMGTDFDVSSYTVRVQSNTLREVGGFVRYTRARGIWYDVSEPSGEYIDNVEFQVELRPLQVMHVFMTYESVDMKNRFLAHTYGTRVKLQLNKLFWTRVDLQRMTVDYHGDEEKMSRNRIYPLFVYNPNAKVSFYAGMQDNREEIQSAVPDIRTDESRYFFKMSYSVDLI